jgi:hypothetical protein
MHGAVDLRRIALGARPFMLNQEPPFLVIAVSGAWPRAPSEHLKNARDEGVQLCNTRTCGFIPDSYLLLRNFKI